METNRWGNLVIEHPFVTDANDKTAEELLDIIGGLSKKLMTASRMNNPTLFNQLQMAINTYKAALTTKQQEQWNKTSGDMTGHIDIQ